MKAAIIGVLFVVCSGVGSASETKTSSAEPAITATAYDLAISVDYDKKILSGVCTITVKNISKQPVSSLPIILYHEMDISSVKTSEGNELSIRSEIVSFEDMESHKARFVTVDLLAPMAPSEEKTITVAYAGRLSGYVDAGMRYVKDHIDREFTILRNDCLACPIVCGPSFESFVKACFSGGGFAYAVKVTVPDDLVVASGGRLLSAPRVDGRVTYAYESVVPTWRMDVCVARYSLIEEEAKGLRVFYLKGNAAAARRVRSAFDRVHKAYSNWFGPLADRSGFTFIQIPEGYGSQAGPGCILLAGDAFGKDPTGMYHEVSHLWNVRSLEEHPSRFESEGLAQFLQYLVQERVEKKNGALEGGFAQERDRFREQCKRNTALKDIAIAAYGERDAAEASYTKGMIACYLLYELLGERPFLDAVRTYYQKYHQTGATLDDFLNVMRDSSSMDLTDFCKAWIYGAESSELLLGNRSLEEIRARYGPSQG